MTQLEKLLNKYPLPVTIGKTEIILKQMKNSICKIENKNGDGTGFLCKILNKKILITNNHVINEEIIKNNNIIKIKLNDNKIKKDIKIKDYYTSMKYDTTIIEIEIEDEDVNYLEIDDDIFDENLNIYNKSIYIIHYPKYGDEQKAAVSYGILNRIQDEYNIIHYCSTDHGSSGSPILKLSNQKIIGIHKEGVSKNNYNRGTFLKYPINEYLNKINKEINFHNCFNANIIDQFGNISKNNYINNYFNNNYMMNNMNNNNNFNNNISNNNLNYNNINMIINMNNNIMNNMNNNLMNKGMNNNIIVNNHIIHKNNDDTKNHFTFKGYEDYFPLIGLEKVDITPLNSILQCLLHIPELNGFFINIYLKQKDHLKEINNDTETAGRLCEEYHKVVLDILKQKIEKKNYVITKNFNNFLCNINGKFVENDAKDLLLYIIKMMHKELNFNGDKKIKHIPKYNKLIEGESLQYFMIMNDNLNLSIISYLFYGILKSISICRDCKTKSYNFQYFKILSFPTLNLKNEKFYLYHGFKEFIQPKLMNGDNKCYCQKCKDFREMKVTTTIFYPPPYLIINIDYGKNKKNIPIEVSLGGIIDIADFVDFADNSNIHSIKYKLIAVCIHIRKTGSSGHYIAYFQNNKDKWYEFNDSSVTETEFGKINSNCPYLLIYKKL